MTEVKVGQVWRGDGPHTAESIVVKRLPHSTSLVVYKVGAAEGIITRRMLRRNYTLVQDEHGNRVGTCSASRGRA